MTILRSALLAVVLAALAVLAPPAQAIVGGAPASRPYPFATQLELRGEDDAFAFACGASVVRPDWVLTAAHCVSGVAPADLRLQAGRTRLSDRGGETLPVAQVLVNEGYTESGGSTHDIALLRLERETSAPAVRIAGLDERATWAPGVRATVIGWGATSFGGDVSDELREVQVPVQADSTCELTVGPTVGYDRATALCAGETLGGGDSCQGDSGGPLLGADGAGRLVQVGVVSYGLGCAYPTQYGVYARIGDRELNDWLTARLPPATPPPSPATPGAAEEPGSATPPLRRVRISVPSRLRVSGGGRTVRLRVRTTSPLTRVRATVTRRGRVVARASRSRIRSRATLALRRRGTLRAGRVTVRVTGRDGDGRTVRRTAAARLSR